MLLFDGITLPLEDPILKFLLILVIILAAPLLLNKLKIPYLLGLIIAGAVIGPHGLNLVLRDSSIILSGTAGLLYIMFLSGLDMDMSDFRKNGTRSLVFGLYTFCVPLLLGILAGYYILGFSIYSSILLAGLFASQTLIAYPIVSKLGIARDKAVTIAVGGTVITDTLALLLLTVIVGMVTGNTDDMFWYRLGISVVLCIAFIMQLFPLIGHWLPLFSGKQLPRLPHLPALPFSPQRSGHPPIFSSGSCLSSVRVPDMLQGRGNSAARTKTSGSSF